MRRRCKSSLEMMIGIILEDYEVFAMRIGRWCVGFPHFDSSFWSFEIRDRDWASVWTAFSFKFRSKTNTCFLPPKRNLAILITETPLALRTGLINISLKVSDDITNLTTFFGRKTQDFWPKVVTLIPIRIRYTIEWLYSVVLLCISNTLCPKTSIIWVITQ